MRIAVAGVGLIGRRHIQLIGESGLCELSAIVDPAPGSQELARSLGVTSYSSLEELFSEQAPDGVILATPNRVHVNNALECVVHGIPALIEKPVAYSVEEALHLAEEAESAGVSLLVGHHRRHGSILSGARRVIESGVLGPLVAVMGSALFRKPDGYFDEGPWRKEEGGGPILINMIHEVDALRWLCGEITCVQGLCSSAARGFSVEDTAAISMRFENGALGSFLVSDSAASAQSWEQTSGENAAYAQYPDEDAYLISGSRGSLSVPTMRLKTYAGAGSWTEPFQESVVEIEGVDPLERQLRHFCSVLRRDSEPLVGVREAARTLRTTLAIREATRCGSVIEIGHEGNETSK